jgi:hypothetical protein
MPHDVTTGAVTMEQDPVKLLIAIGTVALSSNSCLVARQRQPEWLRGDVVRR